MSTQTENIRGLYSGDAYVGQSDLRGDNSVAIEVLSLSANQVMFGNTFPASDYGNNPTVNLQTGRVLYRTNDAAIGANSYVISVSHVYNSQCSKYASRIFRGIGNGWKLNLQQAIVREIEPIGNGFYKQVTRYIDADGNTHEFKLFDSAGMRFYAEDDATNVLTETSTEYVLQDGIGNKFVFTKHTIDGVVVGLLSKSISCQNALMVKYFEYDVYLRLVKVYDGRKKVGNNVKSFVELKYDDVTGLLSSVTAYDKFNKKLSVTRYEYVYDSLAKVYAVALNKAHQEVMTKAVTEFAYTKGKLTSVVDCETKSAMEFVYRADMRIYRVNYGVLCHCGAVSGAKDCGVTVVECGSIAAHLQTVQIKCKKYQEFTYHFLDGSTHVYETDISTERGVAFAHFMNRRGEIVNKMEKVENYLYTLQREQKLVFVVIAGGTGLGEYINGREAARTSRIVAAKQFYNPYECNDQYKQYKVCFNLRHKENYPQLLITCNINFFKSTDSLFSNSLTVTNKIDGTATNCWQEVSVPFNLPEDCNGFDMEIKLTTIDGQKVVTMDFNGVGLCPDSFSYLSLIRNTSLPDSSVGIGVPYAPCKRITFANVYGEDVTDTVNSNFMTDDDLLKTFALIKRKTGDKFDVILNGNTKRICGVSSIDGSFPLEGNVNISSCLPANVNQSLERNIIVEQRFYVTRNDTLVKTIYKENNSNTLSYTEVKTDKYGNTLYSRDEYGVRTEYGYDRYGNLVSKQLFSADGVIGDAEYYFYDDNGERIDRQQSGIVGSSVQYNSFGLAEEINTFNLEGESSCVVSSAKICNTYDIFNDKITHVTEYDGNSVVRQNIIEYQDGRVRRVTDGTIAHGIVNDYIDDEVGYTIMDGEEQCVERKSIVHSSTGGQTHTTTYDIPGQASNRKQSVSGLDKYDRLTNQTSINGQTFSYEYTYSGACATAQNVSRVFNGMSGEEKYEKIFKVDTNSNVVGWTENIGTKQNSIRQLTPSLVQYTSYPNGSREDIFSELTYDTKAIGSPRLSGVTYKQSTTGYYASSNNVLLGNTGYDYDSFGRIYRKALIGLMMKTFRYETKNGHTLLVGSDITDLADIGKEVFYSDSCQYKGSRLVGLTENISDSLSVTNDGLTVNYAYNYDSCGRLTYDYNSENGYRYFVYSNGRLSRVTDSGGSQTCSYNGNGQLVGIGNNTYSYDRYGNRTGKNGQTLYEYNYGNKLVRAAGVDYTYNSDGVRCEKVFSDGKRIRYFLDGNKILRESRSSGDITYLYDADGLVGFTYGGTFYAYIKNAQGSIVALMEATLNIHKLVARYVYDAWGNCTVYNLTRHNNLDETFVGNINPFRWKGLYYDSESGLYYANGSFYDPKTALYVDAADISTVVDRALGGYCLDRTTLLCDNTLEIEGLPHGVFTVTELMPDPHFDPNEGKSWLRKAQDWIALIALRVSAWYRNIPRWVKIAIGVVCLIAAIAITAATQGWGAVALLIRDFAQCLLVGLAVTAVTGQITHETNREEALLDMLADSVLWAGVFAFVSAGINALSHASRTGNACANGECFREGTLVETDSGLKPIEDIEVGDEVLAYDHETGEQAYKPVVRLFRNKTDKWYHVHINEQDIVCTAGHPFYVADLEAFVPAKDLKAGQQVLLADGTCATIEKIRVQKLRAPETTYNFEVENFHTYYVSDDKVLVHNRCEINQMNKEMERGKAPKSVERVDGPHSSIKNSQAHVHFKDGTALNYDWTVHDKKRGTPKLTREVIDWLKKFGWGE